MRFARLRFGCWFLVVVENCAKYVGLCGFDYFVEIYLFRDGDVASAEIVPLSISKVGLGAEIYDFAHNLAPLYGLLAIALAVLAGLGAEAAFRRT